MLLTERRDRFPDVRIIGADTTGKSSTCGAICRQMSGFVQIPGTESFVYDWLRSYNIGRSSTITPEQVYLREQIFLAYNRVQMRTVKEITQTNPVVTVRGRADTITTHRVLRGENPSRSMTRLFPGYMAPSLLVVQTAPISVISQRLDERGQAKTGANSLEFLDKCQAFYKELGNLAAGHFQVIEVDSSNPRNTPDRIADMILGTVEV